MHAGIIGLAIRLVKCYIACCELGSTIGFYTYELTRRFTVTDTAPLVDRPAPRSASTPRRKSPVRLIVVHDQQRRAEEALTAFTQPGSQRAPHYFVAEDGSVTRLVDEHRAAQHSGLARLDGRLRNIDRISVGVAVERVSKMMSNSQAAALRTLLLDLQRRYDLLADAARMRWIPGDENGRGSLQPAALPAVHVRQAVLSGQTTDRSALLGVESDPVVGQRLWLFLQQEAARQRGSSFNTASAFNLHAAKNGLGAALAASSARSEWISFAGQTFNYQHYARDTVFNLGEQWAEVQNLSSLLQSKMPTPGSLAEMLLRSAYKAGLNNSKSTSGNLDFHPEWSSTQLAVSQGLGPSMSAGYRISLGDQSYTIQVFALDTLYTPLASPESGTNWADVRRMSATPAGPLLEQLWVETYKVCGAAYDPNSAFQRTAAEAKLGTPLTAMYATNFEGTALRVQLFALDMLYQDGEGPIQRLSGLPTPPEISAWQPRPVSTSQSSTASAQAMVDFSQPDGDRKSSGWPVTPGSMRPLVSTEERQRIFGTFSYSPAPTASNREAIVIAGTWQQDNIITVQIPQLVGRSIRGAPRDGMVQWHRLATAQLQRLWAAWEQAGLLDRILSWDGAFVPRFIRGSTTVLSNHAFGTAFDINASTNGLGSTPALIGQAGCVRELVTIANRCGFFWGGHFPEPRLDGMHFEVAVLQP